LIWLWVAIEPKDKEILSITISKERNMFVAERFLSNLLKKYGKHPISTETEAHDIPNKHANF
jgi:putative transposase